VISWGQHIQANVMVKMLESNLPHTKISVDWKGQTLTFRLPVSGQASVENAMHVLVCLLTMELENQHIQMALDTLDSVSMRLELKNAINSSYLINDSYNNDLA